jgi:hypothetical protein|tara:strand:+ start:623 stop:973 length:351 start_codon:yes stop_codon:yes gene_type:complete
MKWRLGEVDEAICSRCGQTNDYSDLDRILWCKECVDSVLDWAKARSWVVGVCIGVALCFWIWIVVEPSNMLIGGWAGTVLAAIYVSARVTREVLYGAVRMKASSESQVVSSDEESY